MANIERYGVLSLCFLAVLILGVTLFGGGEPLAAKESHSLPTLHRDTGGLRRTDSDLFRRSEETGPVDPQPLPAGRDAGQYVVKRGDTLSEISQAHYGTVRMVDRILRANPELGDGHLLRPGQRLVLPPTDR